MLLFLYETHTNTLVGWPGFAPVHTRSQEEGKTLFSPFQCGGEMVVCRHWQAASL